MKTLILAASFLALAAAAPASAQTTTPSTTMPSTTPGATAPEGSSASPTMKSHSTTGTSMSRKKARARAGNARMKREVERQSSPATGRKNAATDSDTAHLNQQELGRITQ